MLILGVSLCLLLLTSRVHGILQPDDLYLRTAYPQWDPDPIVGNPGSRLILTPFLQKGEIEKAKKLSKVEGGPFSDNIPSYSGFFTVNKTYNSNLFFWFFPAEEGYDEAPVILWLQGGPGSSSMFGLMTELGPFSVSTDNYTLEENPYSWHKNHSLLFIDNPVGTGFSFTDDEEGYASDQTQVGEELYTAMLQFFMMFPELRTNDFFVAGESYGGKYVPALAYMIYKKNPTAEVNINLQGLVIGNGFSDPESIVSTSEFVYPLGLVSTQVRDKMRRLEERAKKNIRKGALLDAFYDWNQVLGLFILHSRYTNLYNVLDHVERDAEGSYSAFVQDTEVRRALHVGDAEFTSIGIVYYKMIPSFMGSVKSWVEELLDNGYRVVHYNGQLDIIVPYTLSVGYYNTLNFTHAEEYRSAPRRPWYVDGDLAGYVKSGGNFTDILIRNAGHMVPTDQPKWASELIYAITKNTL